MGSDLCSTAVVKYVQDTGKLGEFVAGLEDQQQRVTLFVKCRTNLPIRRSSAQDTLWLVMLHRQRKDPAEDWRVITAKSHHIAGAALINCVMQLPEDGPPAAPCVFSEDNSMTAEIAPISPPEGGPTVLGVRHIAIYFDNKLLRHASRVLPDSSSDNEHQALCRIAERLTQPHHVELMCADDSTQSCASCGTQETVGSRLRKPVLKGCSGCAHILGVYYCSASCQTTDWPRHKAACRKAQKQAHPEPRVLFHPNLHTTAPFERGATVTIVGLVKDSSFNSRRGSIVAFDQEHDRYIVELKEEGTRIRLRHKNLSLAQPLAESNGREGQK